MDCFCDLEKLECFYDLENMELFYDLEKAGILLGFRKAWMILWIRKDGIFYDLEKNWNTFMIYKIYSILINSIFYYNPMREIEEGNGRIHGEWSQGRGREYFKHASRDE